MTVGLLLIALPSLRKIQGPPNDDWADRINHVWTVLLFLVFAFIMGSGMIVGDLIHCWCPPQFPPAYRSYANTYCWVKNTYYVDSGESAPIDKVQREDAELTYYQWSILILLFQAFMFKFPNIVWRKSHIWSGIDLETVVAMATKTQIGSRAIRNNAITHLADYLDEWLEAYREYHMNSCLKVKHKLARFCRFYCRRRAGTFLTGLYLSIKVLYAVNVICQFFILNAFLSTDYNLYGFELLAKMGREDDWMASRVFPLVTRCDFQIPQLQNVQTWTLQCALPLNRLNAKIYTVVWFFLVIVAFLTCLSLLRWLQYFFGRHGSAYIQKCLQIRNQLRTGFEKKLCNQFAEQYLRDDGMFVMRVIAENSTEPVVIDLLEEMWKVYREKQLKPQPGDDVEPTLPASRRENDALTGID